MRTQSLRRHGLTGLVLASAAALALATGTAGAQQPQELPTDLPPLPAQPGGAPSGAPGATPQGLPPLPALPGGGAPGGAGPVVAPLGGFVMPKKPLTPAEKLVSELTPPQPGVSIPPPPLGPDAPMPSADPRDLNGTWFHNLNLEMRMQRDMYGVAVPYNLDGAKVLASRVKSLDVGKPFVNASAKCRPPGPQWQRDLNMPFQIFQSKDWIEFVFEEYHGRWHIVLDPAKAPRPAQKEYMGYSVGHWDGSTLVVETSDFKQAPWLDVDGTPMTANGKMIQRIRKVDNGGGAAFLEIVTTFVDPAYYTRPWSVVRTFEWNPRLTLFDEYNCEEQIGDPATNADAGLVSENQE